jgi:three-Cys-motif partner protein
MAETECTPPDDALPVRSGRGTGPWTLDKLDILRAYLPAFGVACKRTRAWFYVDGFAGPGVNHLPDDQRVCGSPLIALEAEPPFAKCLLLEKDRSTVETLRRRTAPYGDRAEVREGDVNQDLLPMMREFVDTRAPCLCVLDPEGFEVYWSTVRELAEFGTGRLTELLILFQADGLHRILGLADQHDWPGEMATRFFGNDRWQPIAERKKRGELTVEQARDEFLGLYVDGLRQLGYKVDTRDIKERSTEGRLKYILVFASGNTAGLKIMKDCFDNRGHTGEQLQLFRPDRRRRV